MSHILRIARTSFTISKISFDRGLLKISNPCGVCNRLARSSSTKPKVDTFVTIFKFPFIQHVAIGLTLKKYAIAATVGGVIIGGILEENGYVPDDTMAMCFIIGFMLIGWMVTLSFVFKNTIGYIYVTPNLKKLKVSYVDLWGKRVDKVMPTQDWIPLSDLPSSNTDRFFLIPRLYNEELTFRLFLNDQYILDKTKIKVIM